MITEKFEVYVNDHLVHSREGGQGFPVEPASWLEIGCCMRIRDESGGLARILERIQLALSQETIIDEDDEHNLDLDK